MFVFKEGLKKLLKDSLDSRDFESEALLICKVAKIIRKEIFQWKQFQFSGEFPPNCQSHSVPTLLQSLISMLLKGAGTPPTRPSHAKPIKVAMED